MEAANNHEHFGRKLKCCKVQAQVQVQILSRKKGRDETLYGAVCPKALDNEPALEEHINQIFKQYGFFKET